ncbi:hydroxysqualene dehydroxylase HpnE [Schauerella aestuarii]|uniref:hydroxysqualene dehydroxylase HpnE n=1 Tax=Schauerella aestuarii TaxID=2511204 RepID=UPI00136F092F|nr:hydroxysqualene dehydroxylase HpnE [Achromobacter aestuarii]MYZ43424.1 FAD-dependent oxidoreductase [Achromobacter aestuarii]
MTHPHAVAIVGAGWAGLAAATALRERGVAVTVFEAGRVPGGRARRVMRSDGGADATRASANAPDEMAPDAFRLPLDNGQHILLGAYTHTLALMRRLGRDDRQLLLRLPLNLQSLDGQFHLRAPRLPAPLHAAVALLSARGLRWHDRFEAVRLMTALKRAAWRTDPDATVADLLCAHDQSLHLTERLWSPLCLAALNTPVGEASAQLFAHVLRDSLAGSRANSDMLLPRADLSALWPDAATQGCDVRYGTAVRRVAVHDAGVEIDGAPFDAAIVALPPHAAVRLLRPFADPSLISALDAFTYLPIATLTLRLTTAWRLPSPMMMLIEHHERGHIGQWIFDRAHLLGRDDLGELTIVISAAQTMMDGERAEHVQRLIDQVRAQLPVGLAMPQIASTELIVEKRATFAATPGLVRPANATPWKRLALAGDWTDTGYPAVLEGAVASGQAAASIISANLP